MNALLAGRSKALAPRLLAKNLFVRSGSSISVYLLDDVQNRGGKGEIVKVKRGYARNLLIPRKRAVYATEANLLKFGYIDKSVNKAAQEKQVLEMERALEEALRKPLLFSRAATVAGSLFGSVTSNDVRDYLSRTAGGYNLGNLSVETPTSIKSLGEHSIKVNGKPATVIVAPIA